MREWLSNAASVRGRLIVAAIAAAIVAGVGGLAAFAETSDSFGWSHAGAAIAGSITSAFITASLTKRFRDGSDADLEFFALSEEVMCIAGSDGFVRRVNPAFEQVLGYAPAEIMRSPFVALVHPEDLRATVMKIKRVTAGRAVRNFENRVRHRDGTYRWLAWRVTPVPGKDFHYASARDITELKAAQEDVALERARFKFIFESVPVGISLVLPGETEASCVNPAHAAITGIPAAEVTQRDAFKRATHPEDYERQRPLNESFRRREIDAFEIEKRYIHRDKRVVWAALTRRRFTDAKTGLDQVITTLVDVTARKEAEAALADTHRQLMLASRQAGMAEVATGVLHNVGNVLNSVNVSANLLTELARKSRIEPLARLSDLLAAQEAKLGEFLANDPRGQKVPTYIKSFAEHLAQQRDEALNELDLLRKNIDHIKEIVAMQQSYAKLYGMTERVAVAEMIDDALRMNAGALVRHGVSLQTDYQAHCAVLVEKHKVLQILVNLIRNAKYACDAAGRSDKVITIRTRLAGDCVRISVVDNGVGIAAENLSRIFSHGFTTRRDGHGFGLHSGALAAKELGGSLRGMSAGEGHGAEFVLELPLNRAEAAAA
jgi:PAS domain S-box-containing protein